MARIGIFGGSFNPPHLGHILAAKEFYDQLDLDELLLIPAGDPPHKKLSSNSPTGAQRLEMTRLAAQDLENARVLDVEISRDGLSYTADTIETLRETYPHDEFFLLMGTDMFSSFGKWYQPERIVREATLAVARRDAEPEQKILDCARELEETLGAKIAYVRNDYLPHSSTSVRAMIAFGCADSYLAHQVLSYIQSEGLYYAGKNLKQLPYEELAEVSTALHKAKRVPHVQGCSETALELARFYGADLEDAHRAGILHDITKALNGEEQLKLCDSYDMILSGFERAHPKLLHAKTGAEVAQRIFGENEAVCEAIRWHTTGRAEMSLLEQIIYLADYMEPNRTIDGVEGLRAQTWQDLDAAMVTGLEMSVSHVTGHGGEMDHHSLEALRFYRERKQKQ
ncbi:MAG: nicotinate (nicotinamide) nucleotide adenylyltransferase [Oscillospiraceae bacterium]|nr:nicotinate (nicotinamide) nucleotide adenylyltransferase [Oscillospiraceae bacterium]